MNIIKIVRKYLIENNYDGLAHNACDYGCDIDDLMRCGNPSEHCFPAYERRCQKCNEDVHVAEETGDFLCPLCGE
jgi:hypothetical protein